MITDERLRILLATHAPLAPDYGAAQIALNLGDALRRRGHDVVLWSPHPLEGERKWWGKLGLMRAKLEAFAAAQPPFDVIDAPASLLTKPIREAALTIARSVQPDLRYLIAGLFEGFRPTPQGALAALIRFVYTAYHGALVMSGWSGASVILCLGQLERQWMENWFPGWKGKLQSYVTALPETDRERIGTVRSSRIARGPNGPIRFLWLGRWVRHKGVEDLVQFIRSWSAGHPNDTFTIAGCGPSVNAVIPDDLMRSGRMRLVPRYHRDELPEILAAHDVGLFTSRVEGWGLNLNEMLESGMPVLATNAGGVPDIKPYFTDMLQPFPPSDACIMQWSTPSEEKWAAYRNAFAWDSIASHYLNICSTARGRRQRNGALLA